MANNLDKQYTDLLQDILDNGVVKKDRTGTGTKSVFGRQIRHKMSEGFPLLTTKKMGWKQIVIELIWFLRGDTNIQYLVKNGCHIWDGDAYKHYIKKTDEWSIKKEDVKSIQELKFIGVLTGPISDSRIRQYTKEEFINLVKTDDEFAKKWGELGPIYGSQWRHWCKRKHDSIGNQYFEGIDQIQNLLDDLKNNPDSRRLMVTAWNPSDIPNQVLPPCHYGFQCYTTELTIEERIKIYQDKYAPDMEVKNDEWILSKLTTRNIPKRKLSLMWNQRSVDTFLGLPFNIASYGLLLIMLADEVNMIPDELIGNLGDTHLYLNHLEPAKEQIGRDLEINERIDLAVKVPGFDPFDFGVGEIKNKNRQIKFDHQVCDSYGVPRRTRNPFPLPTVVVQDGIFCSSLNDVFLENYQAHPKIEAPLSN